MFNHKIIFRVVMILLVLLSLGSCKGFVYKTAYKHGDRLILNKLDGYFDIQDSQKPFVRSRLRYLHKWHRKNEMPRYTGVIRRLVAMGRDGLTRKEVAWAHGQYVSLRQNLYNKGLYDFCVFLKLLSPEQVDYFEKKLKQSNKPFEKQARKSPATRRLERFKKIVKRLEEVMGDLNPAQKKQIRAYNARIPDTLGDYLQYRKIRQRKFLALIRERKGPVALHRGLLRLVNNYEKDMPEMFKENHRLWKAQLWKLILGVDKLATNVQRAHAIKKMETMAQDFQELAPPKMGVKSIEGENILLASE